MAAPEIHVPLVRIEEWHARLMGGGRLQFGEDQFENAVMLAIVRWMNGLGPDVGDKEHGKQAMANVVAVLG